MVLGHAHPSIVAAITEAAAMGTSYGAPTEREVLFAEALCEAVPSMEKVRLCSSGTEACMSALRLARGFTGRDKVLKFEGCYHGHADAFLIKAGSGPATFGAPTSPGVPEGVAADTRNARFNDAESVEAVFAANPGKVACLIVEPVVGNSGCIPPDPGFLEMLREICTREGALLIFDEVMTGLRLARGGAQELYGITPDLTTLGKVIGGGLPVAAVGGRKDIMQKIAPLGPVYQAGTLSGNPVAVAAGLATLKLVDTPQFQPRIEATTRRLVEGLAAAAKSAGVTFSSQSIGSMFGLYFRQAPPQSFAEVMQCDAQRFNRFFQSMLAQGIYLAPSAYEAGFVSSAHSDEDIEQTLAAAKEAFRHAA
jgi:glutamate-1-semialdehyde 2,1-aminomutase